MTGGTKREENLWGKSDMEHFNEDRGIEREQDNRAILLLSIIKLLAPFIRMSRNCSIK